MLETLEKVSLQKKPGKPKPVYKQIVEQLRRNINERRIIPGDHLPPIQQMVNSWGVGYSTVFTALRILEREGLLNCRTQRGKGPIVLNSNMKKNLQVMFVRWAHNAQFLAIEEGIQSYFKTLSGSTIQLSTIDSSIGDNRYESALRHLITHADGIILYPWEFEKFHFLVEEMLNQGKKIVFVDRTIKGIDVCSVSCDHFRGAYMATRHLIETQKMPVHYFGLIGGSSSCIDRLKGYTEAMNEFGLMDHREQFIHPIKMDETKYRDSGDSSQNDIPALHIEALEFLKNETKNSSKLSVFCINDGAALSVYKAAEELGLMVGRDIFICGFGDKPFCKQLPVPMSSVDQFDVKTGYEAARILHSMLYNNGSEIVHLVLPVELRLRKSTEGLSFSS